MCKRAPGRRCKSHVTEAHDKAMSNYLKHKDSPDEGKRVKAEIALAKAHINLAGALGDDRDEVIRSGLSMDLLHTGELFNDLRDQASEHLNYLDDQAYLADAHLDPYAQEKLNLARKMHDESLSARGALLAQTPLSEAARRQLEEQSIIATQKANEAEEEARTYIQQMLQSRSEQESSTDVTSTATAEDSDLRGVRWGYNALTPDIRVGWRAREGRVFINDNGYVYSLSAKDQDEAREIVTKVRQARTSTSVPKGLRALPTAAAIHDLRVQTRVVDPETIGSNLNSTLNTLSKQRDEAIAARDYRAVAAINDNIRQASTRVDGALKALRAGDTTERDTLPPGLKSAYHVKDRMDSMLDQRIVGRDKIASSTGAFVPGQQTVVVLEGNRNISGTIYRDRGEIGVEEANGKRTPFYSHAYNNLTPHVLKGIRIVS